MPKRRDKNYGDMGGVNLFHAARSNCSARVRLLLSEKKVAWNSHPISLQKRENRTAKYFAINPKGLVPSLIHNGWVVTESNDILFYLEDSFPENSFSPSSAAVREAMSSWLELSAKLHLPGVKTLNYSRNQSGAAANSHDDMDRYRALQADQELVRFHEKAGGSGFSIEERTVAANLLANALRAMDDLLSKQQWLTDESYSLADICWAPTIPTIVRGGLDLALFPHVRAWHHRIADRPAYFEAVTQWEQTQ